MKNVRESDQFKSYDTWEWGDYQALIDTFEFETVLSVDAGAYQGDTFCILKDGERYGYLEFGWEAVRGAMLCLLVPTTMIWKNCK